MSDLENQNKNFNDYIPKDIEIKILPPEKKVIKRKIKIIKNINPPISDSY